MDIWDSKYKLSTQQKDLYMQLHETSKQLPLPSKFTLETNKSHSIPSHDFSNSFKPIETTQQFLDWFTEIEKEMNLGLEEDYKKTVETLSGYCNVCLQIQRDLQSASDTLDSLKKNNSIVYEKTSGLQATCENLLHEQKQTMDLATELDFKLSYFNSLEMVMKYLNTPGDNLCTEPEFIPTLGKLDHCLAFVKGNSNYKDSNLYLMRYRQCMTRAMTMIKIHVVNSIRSALSDIKDKDIKPDEPLSSSLQLQLFYAKFSLLASVIKPIIHELESRSIDHPEYLALVKDCCLFYVSCRKSLLSPYITRHVESISSLVLLEFSKLGCAYMLQLCSDELKLYQEFFELGEEDLISYLEFLGMILYNQFRPMILKQVKIDDLADLCQSLLVYMDSNSVAIVSPTILKPHVVNDDASSAVKFLVRKTLQDAQNRLVFRVQEYIRTEIQGFKPRLEDVELLARGRGLPNPVKVSSALGLDKVIDDIYDSKHDLQMMDIVHVEEEEVGDEEEELFHSHSSGSGPRKYMAGKLAYGGGEWYPTLQRTMYILSKLYGNVPMTVFADVASEAVDICRQSLVLASNALSSKSSKQMKLDGQLFLIKNLLMLREQVIPFDAELIRKEEVLDFPGMIDALTLSLTSVIRNSWTFDSFGNMSGNLLALSAPPVIQSYADAKKLLDGELKRVCEDVILETAKASIEPISSFLLKVSAFQLRNSTLSHKEYLYKQNFASPEHVLNIFHQFNQVLQETLVKVLEKMKAYLGDKKTEFILIKVIRMNILENYQAFHDVVTSEYEASIWNKIDTVLEVATAIDQWTGRRGSLKSMGSSESLNV